MSDIFKWIVVSLLVFVAVLMCLVVLYLVTITAYHFGFLSLVASFVLLSVVLFVWMIESDIGVVEFYEELSSYAKNKYRRIKQFITRK